MTTTPNIKPSVKLSIYSPDAEIRSVLGRGVVELLTKVDETGSLNKAAKEMSMAYSKAWRITKGTEEALGIKLVESVRPNGTILTEDGKKLIKIYDQLRKELNEHASKRFEELLKQF